MHPIVAYYQKQKKLIIIDGHGQIKEIFNNLVAKIEKNIK